MITPSTGDLPKNSRNYHRFKNSTKQFAKE